jgi:hypothetical protein
LRVASTRKGDDQMEQGSGDQNTRARASRYLLLGISIGLAIGVAVGVAMGSVALGVGIGLSLGVAVGLALERMRGTGSGDD